MTAYWQSPIAASADRLREETEHRKHQRFSFKIIVLGVARRAVDLFPYLCQPCKARKIGIGAGIVGPQARRNPAVHTVDKCAENNLIATAERVTQRMQFTGINDWQGIQQSGGALMQLECIPAQQGQCARDAAFCRFSRLSQGEIVDGYV